MNNVLNQVLDKKASINSNVLQTSLQRDMNYALLKKPSLDGLSQIDLTPVEKPFLNMDNLKLSQPYNLVNNIQNGVRNKVNLANNTSTDSELNPAREILNQQVSNLKNQVLNSGNVAQVVEMRYQNNNGVENGLLKQINMNSLPNNKIQVQQKIRTFPQNGNMEMEIENEGTIIKTFTIDSDDEEDSGDSEWVPSNLNDNNNQNNDDSNDNNLEGELYGVKTVDATPEVKAERAKNNNKRGNNELKNAYADMMKNMYSNKLLMLIFLILIIVIVYVMKRK